jgi:hypothetical protein
VDPAALRHETGVSNTRDQIDWVVLFVREHPDSRVAVVASRLQMPRVRALADAQNLRVAFVAAPIDTDPASVGWRRLWPSYAALRASRDAIYEHAALAYYRWRGWIAGNDAVTGAASAVEWPGR